MRREARLAAYLTLVATRRRAGTKPTITSSELGVALGLDPSFVRRDLSTVPAAGGSTKIGYSVAELEGALLEELAGEDHSELLYELEDEHRALVAARKGVERCLASK